MAGIVAVLRVVGRLAVRDLRTLSAAGTNNFFLFCLLLAQAGLFLQVIVGVLVLFPLSADPLGRVPASRWALWPFDGGERVAIRLASLLLSPAAWLTVLLVFWTAKPGLGIRFAVLSLAMGVVMVAFALLTDRLPALNLMRYVPPVPGALGGLIRKDLRELLSLLDPYAALILAIAGAVYRWSGQDRDGQATLMASLLVVLALSTWTQALFGLDSDSALTRYALLPVRGWQILAAKDGAFLLVLAPLVAALNPVAALGSALAVLTVGHHASLARRVHLRRWRFAGGGPLTTCLIQTVILLSTGVAIGRSSAWWLAGCAAVWAGSLYWHGSRWDSGNSQFGLRRR